MGWHRIDPETGMPLEGGHSKLSRPPEFVLLNAVPGADDDEDGDHFLGDGPWDMASSAVQKVEALIGSTPRPTEDEADRLFLERVLPQSFASLPPDSAEAILRL